MLKYLYLNMLNLCELILHNSLFQLVASLFSLRDEHINLCLIMNEIKKVLKKNVIACKMRKYHQKGLPYKADLLI